MFDFDPLNNMEVGVWFMFDFDPF